MVQGRNGNSAQSSRIARKCGIPQRSVRTVANRCITTELCAEQVRKLGGPVDKLLTLPETRLEPYPDATRGRYYDEHVENSLTFPIDSPTPVPADSNDNRRRHIDNLLIPYHMT